MKELKQEAIFHLIDLLQSSRPSEALMYLDMGTHNHEAELKVKLAADLMRMESKKCPEKGLVFAAQMAVQNHKKSLILERK